MVEYGDGSTAGVILTAREGWHPGIVGLIAVQAEGAFPPPGLRHRLPERHRHRLRPLHQRFDIAGWCAPVSERLLVKGGGHAMAAGLTVEKAKLGAHCETSSRTAPAPP